MPNNVPFLDLVTPHKELEQELTEVFKEALGTARFIGGPRLLSFEENFARFAGAQHCIGVSSGTCALRFALIAMGVGKGDIVVTVPNTFIATTEAISQAGAEIRFVDIDEKTYNMAPENLRKYLESECALDDNGITIEKESGKQVSAIIPVHLYGQPADMDPIMELASRYNLFVLEDACQAHGAQYYSRKAQAWQQCGSIGHAAAFSFYPGKNLGALGEGGAITTNNDDIAHACRMLKDHGQSQKYIHGMEGYNGRLDAIQAGFLGIKLKKLPEWNQQRVEAAATYTKLLKGNNAVITPFTPEWAQPVYHLYIIRVKDRDSLQKILADNGIGSGLHYPIPLHLQKAYSNLYYSEGSLPVTELTAKEIISLPMFPGLTKAQIESVVEVTQNQ
ncbi:MAG: erythromycin biosynthesis sensory transduction protein eryC1 [Chitinivibrionales bacterium]|nr:erythromycin biosynthesis sensory transduction protein eryC1 [Chitinivibrionales bacterium]